LAFAAALAPGLWPPSHAQTVPLLDILSQELQRNFLILKDKADPPPYFISYSVTDQEVHSISATLGAVQADTTDRARVLDITVRVGTPQLDNYHALQGERPRFTPGVFVSLDDNPNALQRRIWLDTDRTYRNAAQRLIRIRTNKEVKVQTEDESADFSPAAKETGLLPPPVQKFDHREWADKLRRWSAEFSRYPAILSSMVAVAGQTDTKYLVNTEGTLIRHGRAYARISILAQAKAADGMDLQTSETLEANEPGRLPKDSEVLAAIRRVGEDLTGLLRAPEVEPFVGPAILSGRAAGVFFHEIFGHRIEGHRQKDESEGQTFTKSVGTKVLPEFLSVISDPTLRSYGSTDLYGWYDYDDEGIKSRRVPVIEDGVLKAFLLSRSPVSGFPESNGHGRRQPGFEVVSRQSNLIIESARKVPDARLREMLIEEVKRQGKPYGMFMRNITGGFTTTQRRGLQAFTVIPLVVYRVYPDGRPDELVRGVDIVGTPLASFGKILATSDRPEIFNGYCGAESGSVPVSAVAPAILVSEIEVQKKVRAEDRPPLLGRPTPVGGSI
jgi:predicted Zn-dependent protease